MKNLWLYALIGIGAYFLFRGPTAAAAPVGVRMTPAEAAKVEAIKSQLKTQGWTNFSVTTAALDGKVYATVKGTSPAGKLDSTTIAL